MFEKQQEEAVEWKMEKDPDEATVPMTKIIVHNVTEFTEAGLRALCSHYGTVQDAFKVKENLAFVEFSTENEATVAVQQLNSKRGFGFQADFARPKESTHDPVPVTNALLDDESWEEASSKRRFNLSFSLPLCINFPEHSTLETRSDYLGNSGDSSKLRQTDPECFFNILKVTVPVSDVTNPPKSLKPVAIKSGTCYTHRGLKEQERGKFGPIKRCAACQGYGYAYCAQCGTSYCSTMHQKLHSAEHALSCAGDTNQPPGTQSITIKTNELNSNQGKLMRDALPLKAKVYITAVLTHKQVFVRSADAGADREYLKTIGDAAKAGALALGAEGPKVEPETGGIYLAPYQPLGVYARVLVTEVSGTFSKCVYVEYGWVKIVCNDDLLPIHDVELRYRKVFVYKVCLVGITEQYGMIEKAIAYLNRLKNQSLWMTYRLEQCNFVDVLLRAAREGNSVNDIINCKIEVPPLLAESDHEAYIMYKKLAQSEPIRGKAKAIMILNRTTIQLDYRVTWIAVHDLPYLEDLQKKLQCYGTKVNEFRRNVTPRLGELCLVRYGNNWYRAVCHETAGDSRPALFLCDYGCMVMANLADIRKIPAQFATEVRTHDGIVAGLEEAKDNGLKMDSLFFDLYLPENEVMAVDITELEIPPLVDGEEMDKHTVLTVPDLTSFLQSCKNRSNEDTPKAEF
ncbi:protein vreteno [Anopheles bellator]|uniref:protein vreteno n=1 Tax=Anopheles bellator TaxID=139047 RepID=UPI002648C290|nr:protein vreteno [Anopheles bellator]